MAERNQLTFYSNALTWMSLHDFSSSFFTQLATCQCSFLQWIGVKQAATLHKYLNQCRPSQWPIYVHYAACKTSYRKISWTLEAVKLDVKIITLLWNLKGGSTTMLPIRLANFRTIEKVKTRISQPRGFVRSCDKMSVRLTKKEPGFQVREVLDI